MAVITSLLDNDLYKFNMLQFIVDQKKDKLVVGCRFFSRGENKFPIGFAKELQKEVDRWSTLSFKDEELDFIYSKTRMWINYDFIYGYLKSYKINSGLIKIVSTEHKDVSGKTSHEEVAVCYEGEWAKIIFFEVMLLAAMSEIYNRIRLKSDKEFREQCGISEFKKSNYCKFNLMNDIGISFYEFGTRRRFSKKVQEMAIKQAKTDDVIKGTSNLFFAMKYDLPIFGTMAHELFSVFATVYGVESANYMVISKWAETFNGSLGIALTDTFTTKSFYQHSFNRLHAELYDGLREDSAPSPLKFVDEAIEFYRSMGINPKSKTIIHSNAISSIIDMKKLLHYRKDEIGRALGVGSFITNNITLWSKFPLYENSPEVSAIKKNWVIKTTHVFVNGQKRYTVKLSDEKGKVTSVDGKTVMCYRYLLGV